MVTPGYFATLDQPLLLGREFSDGDNKGAAHVAIVNERFVSQYMPGRNPIGEHFKAAGGDVAIVGLVKTARYQTVREAPTPQVYLPVKQSQSSGFTLLVRTSGSVRGVIADVEHAIHAVDAKTPIYQVRTLQERLDQGISNERILSFLSALFGALATLLCAIGLYGVIGYGVSRRTREIGVRFAIGAQRSDVASLFVREALVRVGGGILLGVPAALAASRLFGTVLFGVTAGDLPTLAFAATLLAVAALLATALPVRRASAIEPLEALRYE